LGPAAPRPDRSRPHAVRPAGSGWRSGWRPRRGDRGGAAFAIPIAFGEVLTQSRAAPAPRCRRSRRVALPVIGRVVADDINYPRHRLVGCVDVGQPVGEAGADAAGRGRLSLIR
jgi:hypothetical protein